MADRIGISLLNWNSTVDTIECIESLKMLEGFDGDIVVVDNNSREEEVSRLVDYCNESHKFNIQLILNNKNLGFGKANNIAFNYLIEECHVDYIWLLNNDTIVSENTLINLLDSIKDGSDIGMVGSTMVYLEKPSLIQTVGGGKYYPILGLSKLIWKNKRVSDLEKTRLIPSPDFLMGCSILLRKECIEQLGGFDERYFVYGEDVDLSIRAKQLGWKIGVSRKSIVLHKDSGSTKNRKDLFYFLFAKGNVLNTKIHFPQYVLISLSTTVILCLLKSRNLKNTIASIKGGLEAFRIKN